MRLLLLLGVMLAAMAALPSAGRSQPADGIYEFDPGWNPVPAEADAGNLPGPRQFLIQYLNITLGDGWTAVARRAEPRWESTFPGVPVRRFNTLDSPWAGGVLVFVVRPTAFNAHFLDNPPTCHSAYPMPRGLSYAEGCVPVSGARCQDLSHANFPVLPPDPFGYDPDGDGIGCEE